MTNETNETAKYPAARPEIVAQIIALDCQLADLSLKCQGNARELDELAGVLDNHLACCEFERDSLMGIAENARELDELAEMIDKHLVCGEERCNSLNLTDLPADQQRLILESAVFGGVALQTLQKLSHADVEFLMQRLSEGVKIISGEMTEKQITESLQRYLKMHQQGLSNLVFYSNIQPNNN